MTLTAEELKRTAVWRDRYFATTDKEVRKGILKDAAAAFGIGPAAVYKRWSDNGMIPEETTLTKKFRELIARHPYQSDREIARREGVKADSVRWFRRKLGIPPGCRQRRAVLEEEVAIYVENWPDMTSGEVYRSIVADDEMPFAFNRWSIREVWIALHDRRRAEVDAVRARLAVYPWATPADILDDMLADGSTYAPSLARVVECVAEVNRG